MAWAQVRARIDVSQTVDEGDAPRRGQRRNRLRKGGRFGPHHIIEEAQGQPTFRADQPEPAIRRGSEHDVSRAAGAQGAPQRLGRQVRNVSAHKDRGAGLGLIERRDHSAAEVAS